MTASELPESQAGPRPAAGFDCTVEPSQSDITIRLRGDFDLAGLAKFERALAHADIRSASRVTLDLSGLHFIDSTGLRAILKLRSDARLSSRLRVVRGPPAVQRVFELVGLTNVLTFTDGHGDERPTP